MTNNDAAVSENYQRLISQTLSGVFNTSNDSKTVETLREEIIGRIRNSLSNVFDDLLLTSIGDPLSNGSFYFTKGLSKDFHYKNLSAGEKSAFDIILDVIIKSNFYSDDIFCIDEPEAHMHTRLQAKFLLEMYSLIPSESQLWISTHSIGMLKQAEELETQNPGSVVFLNFENRDFDTTEIIEPARIDKAIWGRFFDLALGEFSSLIAPKRVVFCEGTPQGRKYKDFDAQIYGRIFENKYYDTSFVSAGGSSEVENIDNQSIKVLSGILKSSTVVKFVDRDDKSIEEIAELSAKGIKTLRLRHIKSYLLDDEIIMKLCIKTNNVEKCDDCITAKNAAIAKSVVRGNSSDDIKSASGDIFVEIKKILNLTRCGNNTSSFLRDTMAPLITEDTNIYQQLEAEIF